MVPDQGAGQDPEATQLRPRGRPARARTVPLDAWDNVAAWAPAPAARRGIDATEDGADRGRADAQRPQSRPSQRFTVTETDIAARPSGRTPSPARERSEGVRGPLRRTAPERPGVEAPPQEVPRHRRVGLLILMTAFVAALVMIIPSWFVASEPTTNRAITVAHGPLPRRAESARLPGEVVQHRRVAAGDQTRLPWGHIDMAVYADAGNARQVTVLTQKLQIGTLEEFDQRMGMRARRFGRVTCGQRYDAQQCTMLLEGGTLTVSTIDPVWQLEDLAGFVRQVYVRLPA